MTDQDAFVNTSAIQYASADEVVKEAPASDGAQAGGGLETNATSMFWAMKTLIVNGTHAWNFGFQGPVDVRHNSQVSVTMTELDQNDRPFLGQASMQVYNVVPLDDGTITVRFNVGFSSQLRVRFNFIIVN